MAKSLEDLKKFIEEKQPTYYGIYTYPSNYNYVTGSPIPKKLVKVILKSLNVEYSSGLGIIQPWKNSTMYKDSHRNIWCFNARKKDDSITLEFMADDYGQETVLFVKMSEDFKTLYSQDWNGKDEMVLIIDEYETVEC